VIAAGDQDFTAADMVVPTLEGLSVTQLGAL